MLAKFVKFTTTGKTAICMVKQNSFALGAGSPVYLDADAVRATIGETPDKGTSFSLPENSELVPMTWVDQETGEIIEAKTEDGIALLTIKA